MATPVIEINSIFIGIIDTLLVAGIGFLGFTGKRLIASIDNLFKITNDLILQQAVSKQSCEDKHYTINKSLCDKDESIEELYNRTNNHETRISVVESKLKTK